MGIGLERCFFFSEDRTRVEVMVRIEVMVRAVIMTRPAEGRARGGSGYVGIDA